MNFGIVVPWAEVILTGPGETLIAPGISESHDTGMKSSRLFPMLKIEAVQLSDEVIGILKARRFRTVQEILSFGIFDVALLCGMDSTMAEAIRAALDAPPRNITFFSGITPYKKANSFEERIRYSCDSEFLELSAESLSLSIRAARVLNTIGLRTIADILNYGLPNLTEFANVGDFTRRNIENAILDLMDGELLNQSTGFRTLLDCLLPEATIKRDILEARFGLGTGKGCTLRELAQRFDISCERVRKIILDEMRKITLGKSGIALNLLRQRVEVVLIRNGYIAAIEDITAHPLFRAHSKRRVLFLIKLLSALFPKCYRIIDDHYLTTLSPGEVFECTQNITSVYREFKERIAMAETALIDTFSLSRRYVLHCLEKTASTIRNTDRLGLDVT